MLTTANHTSKLFNLQCLSNDHGDIIWSNSYTNTDFKMILLVGANRVFGFSSTYNEIYIYRANNGEFIDIIQTQAPNDGSIDEDTNVLYFGNGEGVVQAWQMI